MNIERLKQPDIGNLIKSIRHDLQLSQEKFASQLGVSFSSLNRWENHKAMPSSLALKNINIYFNSLKDQGKDLLIL
ncbi:MULTISPECIES: helix-turn-helix domain-containing protein [Pseudanabaena]|jgi:putative transcriptional regulator|uniref:helix-turn-helix domain-containing protein n=1 Tax=Pseudanabaena TaxID=1152 RepID=UPI00247B278E|nr:MULTISPECIES: helix-turn-helix transcriptional regulator [Pseudanabaena]MEA5487476.1 helix-turn-helix transcriptional regulator [Pseudanabaena sp. CCNP1317]WGS74047.1 helix-turn-helix transcriptional regulator [Pseudanabaena galeata CCNP1313]